jgi:ankyrin repeat protein
VCSSPNPSATQLQGEFKRTPLWRAAFLGQLQVLAPLLEAGADPRIPNEGGELPEHVASQAPCVLSWRTDQT